MAALKKTGSKTVERKSNDSRVETGLGPTEDLIIAEPGVSPAKVMQDQLDAHFMPVGQKMSARFVTLLVMFTCVGSWVGGIGLYSTL